MRRIVGDIRDVLLRRTMKTPSFFYDNFYDKSNKVMTSYVRLCTLMKTVWINKVSSGKRTSDAETEEVMLFWFTSLTVINVILHGL